MCTCKFKKFLGIELRAPFKGEEVGKRGRGQSGRKGKGRDGYKRTREGMVTRGQEDMEIIGEGLDSIISTKFMSLLLAGTTENAVHIKQNLDLSVIFF
jgi:hypothetical protein